MNLKDVVRKDAPTLFKLLRCVYRFPGNYWRPVPCSIVDQLRCYCGDHKPITFVQIGANDGNDDFADLRREFKWNGIMVEPQEDVFCRLVAANQFPGVTFERVAIAAKSGTRPLFKIGFSQAHWATTLTSFDRSIIEKHIADGWIGRCAAAEGIDLPQIDDEIYATELVKCVTLAGLVEKHKLGTVDVLLIDTEGSDLEILLQITQLSQLPDIIVFEHKHMQLGDFHRSCRWLRSLGYYLCGDSTNTLARRR
jgi:FkbM family methyltransferase